MKVTLNKILLVVIVVAIGFLAWNHTAKKPLTIDEQNQTALNTPLDDLGSADVPLDNTNSTLRTLATSNKLLRNQLDTTDKNVQNIEKELARLSQSPSTTRNRELEEQIALLTQKIAELEERPVLPSSNNSLNPVEEDTTSDSISGNLVPAELTPIDSPNGTGNQVLDMLVQPGKKLIGGSPTSSSDAANNSAKSSSRIVWIDATDRIEVTDEKTGEITTMYAKSFEDLPMDSEGSISQSDLTSNSNTSKEEGAVPIITVPANSTLFGSVGMSAIIGRVPIQNSVQDPFRFKVLIGGDNLASNGQYIPYLESMTVSGDAIGDFTLECTRGNIDKVTFTFLDQTVRVIKAEGQGSLGWISDKDGVPCIAGRYISNFTDYVLKQGSLTTLSAFASAIAQQTVTTTTGAATGTTTQSISNSGQYAVGKGFEQGTQEVVKWYAERQTSAFDAVFVETGRELVVNIEETLEIDYEPKGRKLFHEDNAREYLEW
ncbi:TIGR03752 family integrating conjugative element protein [Vibrio mediterranei]